MRGPDAVAFVFVTAMHLILEEGIRPDDVHREFMSIDEYRDNVNTVYGYAKELRKMGL